MSQTARVSIAILCQHVPETVERNWTASLIGGRPLLNQLVAYLARNIDGAEKVVIVGSTGSHFERLRRQVTDVEALSVAVEWRLAPSPRASLAPLDIAPHLEAHRVLAVFQSTACFPNAEWANRAIGIHVNCGASVTYCEDSPDGALPLLYSTTALRHLSEIVPNEAREQLDLIGLIRNLSATEAEGLPGLSARRLRLDEVVCDSELPGLIPESVLLDSTVAHETLDDLYGALESIPRDVTEVYSKYAEALQRTHRFRMATFAKVEVTRTAILFATNHVGYSGGEESLVHLLRGIVRRGRFTPILLVPFESLLARRAAECGSEVIIAGHDLDFPHPDAISYFCETLAKNNARIVHINGWAGTLLPICCSFTRTPLVAHVRTIVTRPLPAWYRFVDRFFAVSDSVRRSLVRCGMDNRRVKVVRNFVADSLDQYIMPADAAADPSSAWPGGIEGVPIVLLVSRICPEKRIHLFIDIIAHLKRTIPNIHGVICGEADARNTGYANLLEKMCRQKNIHANIEFTGFIKDLERVYRRASALVLLNPEEPFGRCVLEAAYFGVPMALPPTGGHVEVFVGGDDFLPIDVRSHSHVSDAICRILTNREYAMRLARSANGRLRSLKPELSISSVSAVYDDLLSLPR